LVYVTACLADLGIVAEYSLAAIIHIFIYARRHANKAALSAILFHNFTYSIHTF
jgi:hypothetical protein